MELTHEKKCNQDIIDNPKEYLEDGLLPLFNVGFNDWVNANYDLDETEDDDIDDQKFTYKP